MLLAALARPDRVAGLVGIAAAPDFTEWGFTIDEKMTILNAGKLEQPSAYSAQPTLPTRAFWSSVEANRLLHGENATEVPGRLNHGQAQTQVAGWISQIDRGEGSGKGG